LLNSFEGIEVEVTGEEVLTYHFRTKAISRSRFDPRPVFANGILTTLTSINHGKYNDLNTCAQARNRVSWSNGIALSNKEINTLIDIQDSLVYLHPWQENDILIFDNIRNLHGRIVRPGEVGSRALHARFGLLSESSLKKLKDSISEGSSAA
jgi:hypothetical protein